MLGPVKLRDVDEAQAAIVATGQGAGRAGRDRDLREARTRRWCTSMDGLLDIPAGAARPRAPSGILFAEDFDAAAQRRRAGGAGASARRSPPTSLPPAGERLRGGPRSAACRGRGRRPKWRWQLPPRMIAERLADRTHRGPRRRRGRRAHGGAAAARDAGGLAARPSAPATARRGGGGAARGPARIKREPALTLRANPRLLPALSGELARLDPELARADRLGDLAKSPLPAISRISWQHGAPRAMPHALWTRGGATRSLSPDLPSPRRRGDDDDA